MITQTPFWPGHFDVPTTIRNVLLGIDISGKKKISASLSRPRRRAGNVSKERLCFAVAERKDCYVRIYKQENASLWIGSTCFDLTENIAREAALLFDIELEEVAEP